MRPPRPRTRPVAATRGPRAVAAALAATTLLGGVRRAAAQTVSPVVDTVSIRLAGDTALVRHRIPALGDRVVALALRFPGQRLEMTGVVREGEALLDATLREEEDAYRFEVESGAPILLSYRVTGDLERIPLFVPGVRAELTVAHEFDEPHLVRLSGPPARLDGIDTDVSLPRFGRVSEGLLEARLSSLPSFVRIAPGGVFSFGRLADLIALAAILVGAAWAWRRIRRQRARGAAAGDGG